MALSPEELNSINNLTDLELEQYLKDDINRDRLVEYFGGEKEYESLRELVSQPPDVETTPDDHFGSTGVEIILLPGIMGSELADTMLGKIWVGLGILAGALTALTLDSSGRKDKNEASCFEPVSIYRGSYWQTQKWLEEKGHTVYPFAYDWRKSIDVSAARLQKFVEEKAGDRPDKKFIFVAHSMGGLVARRYLDLFGEWAEKRLRKLIMLGTPNHGSFLPMKVMAGAGDWQLKIAEHLYGNDVLQGVIQSFPGLYEMLPSPYLKYFAQSEDLYKVAYWSEQLISENHLIAAQEFHKKLQACIPDRMVLIANNSLETPRSVDRRKEGDQVRFKFGVGWGDNTVPFDSAYLEGVDTYLTTAKHSEIQKDTKVLQAIDDIINGKALDLPKYDKDFGPPELPKNGEINPDAFLIEL